MALPLPRVVSDVGPGGPLVTSMGGINALRQKMLEAEMQKLKNKYYGPNIESVMNNRNALTKGQNIQNEFMPEKLRRANELAALVNEYYGPNMQSTINNRNSLTTGNNINNEYLPEKLRQEAARREFEANNPLLKMPGTAGQIGSLAYINDHPELFNKKSNTNQNQYMPGQGNAPLADIQNEETNYGDILKESIKNQLKPKGNAPTREFKNAQGYQDAKEGFVPFTDRKQKITDEGMRQYFMNALNPNESHKAIQENQEKQRQIKRWDSLTPDTKAHLVAIGQGAGIRGDQIRNEIVNGKDFDDILYEHGFNPDNPPEPIYELTSANRKALNEREYASREVKYISNFINKATGNYANKVKGYSLAQVKDALTGKNEEQQARYLAARALAPELINLRLILGGAKGTVHAIKSMADKSMLNSKIFEPLVSNKVWHRSQEIADEQLQKAFSASKKGYGAPNKPANNKNEKPDFKKMTEEELRAYIGE